MAQSLFIQLKRDNPDLHLGVMAPNWSGPLLDRMPEVDEHFSLTVGHKRLGLKARWAVAQRIKASQFDQAIVLQRSFKSALVPVMAGIKIRTGYLGEQRYGLLNDIRPLDKTLLPMNVQRFLALTNAQSSVPTVVPKPALQSNQEDRQQVKKEFYLHGEKILSLCPGAEFGDAKQWPAAHYANVASEKIKQGWQVVLLGSAGDKKIADEIVAQCKQPIVNLAGKTSLGQVIDIIASSDAVVSNDSGLMHIAAGLNVPLVAVYGSSSPDFTPPLSDNSQIVKLDLSCQPCFKRSCPLGHVNCLKQLAPQEVLQRVS